MYHKINRVFLFHLLVPELSSQEPPMETDSTSVVESEATVIVEASSLAVPPTPPPVDDAPIACSLSAAVEATR